MVMIKTVMIKTKNMDQDAREKQKKAVYETESAAPEATPLLRLHAGNNRSLRKFPNCGLPPFMTLFLHMEKHTHK